MEYEPEEVKRKGHPYKRKLSVTSEEYMRTSADSELNARRAEIQRGAGMALLLEELNRLESGDTSIKRNLKDQFRSWGIKFESLKDKQLEKAYWELSKNLQRHFSRTESLTTTSERKFIKYFKSKPGLSIYGNFWISNFQVDVVIPGVAQGKSVGIAFEIDGPIHNFEKKMTRDLAKIRFLERHFNTPVKGIHNHDVTFAEVQKIILSLQAQRRTDSRKLKGWWRRVYIYTLAFGGERFSKSIQSTKILCDMLNLNRVQIESLIEIVSKKKSKRFRELFSKDNL
ncbi:MAG: hypothetical protein V4736_03685 [Bdellovibrionota bacterium]